MPESFLGCAQGKLPPNSLVRYCGMVQDQYEPEYFVGSFEQIETATGQRSRVDVKYADAIAQKPGFVNEYDGPGAKTMERCVASLRCLFLSTFSFTTVFLDLFACYEILRSTSDEFVYIHSERSCLLFLFVCGEPCYAAKLFDGISLLSPPASRQWTDQRMAILRTCLIRTFCAFSIISTSSISSWSLRKGEIRARRGFNPYYHREAVKPSPCCLLSVVWSRLPLFCVPVPGQSPWARPQEEDVGLVEKAQQDHGQGLPKRQREEASADEMDCTVCSIMCFSPTRSI